MNKLKNAKHGLVTMLGSILNLIMRLVRIKLLAVFFGPVGFGQIGLLTNFLELISTIISAGIAGTLNRELPRQNIDKDRKAVISTTIFLFLISLFIIITPSITLFFLLSTEFSFSIPIFIILLIAILSASFSRFLIGFFQGLQLSKKFFTMTVATGTTNLIIVIGLIYWDVKNIFIYIVSAPVIIMVFSLIVIAKYIKNNIDWSLIDKNSISQILRMAFPITLTTMMIPLTLYYIRSFTEVALGSEALGLIQPGLQLVALIAMMFASFASMTIIRWDQSREIGYSPNQLKLLFFSILLPIITIPLLFITTNIQAWGVRILFSAEFLPAVITLPWFLSGEIFRISGFLLNQTFISKGYNWYTIIPRLACSIFIVILLHSQLGYSILAISQAYFYGHLVFLIISIMIFLYIQHSNRIMHQ